MIPFVSRWVAWLCSAPLVAGLAAGAQNVTPQGHWVGSIRTPGGSLGITVDLAQPAESPWVGKISIPAQGLKDFVLSDVAVDGDKVSFAMKGVPGSPRFRGRLSKNFDRLSGDFSQGGGQFRFSLERSGDVDPVAVVAQKPPPPQMVGVSGKGLAGIWLGRLEIGQVKLRLLFRIASDEEGMLSGTMDSLDQGAMGLEITKIHFKDQTVRLRFTTPPASFEGRMSDDGSKIIGNWRQGGQAAPLTVKRQLKAPDQARSQEPERPYPYREEHVIFRNEEATLTLAGAL